MQKVVIPQMAGKDVVGWTARYLSVPVGRNTTPKPLAIRVTDCAWLLGEQSSSDKFVTAAK